MPPLPPYVEDAEMDLNHFPEMPGVLVVLGREVEMEVDSLSLAPSYVSRVRSRNTAVSDDDGVSEVGLVRVGEDSVTSLSPRPLATLRAALVANGMLDGEGVV